MARALRRSQTSQTSRTSASGGVSAGLIASTMTMAFGTLNSLPYSLLAPDAILNAADFHTHSLHLVGNIPQAQALHLRGKLFSRALGPALVLPGAVPEGGTESKSESAVEKEPEFFTAKSNENIHDDDDDGESEEDPPSNAVIQAGCSAVIQNLLPASGTALKIQNPSLKEKELDGDHRLDLGTWWSDRDQSSDEEVSSNKTSKNTWNLVQVAMKDAKMQENNQNSLEKDMKNQTSNSSKPSEEMSQETYIPQLRSSQEQALRGRSLHGEPVYEQLQEELVRIKAIDQEDVKKAKKPAEMKNQILKQIPSQSRPQKSSLVEDDSSESKEGVDRDVTGQILDDLEDTRAIYSPLELLKHCEPDEASVDSNLANPPKTLTRKIQNVNEVSENKEDSDEKNEDNEGSLEEVAIVCHKNPFCPYRGSKKVGHPWRQEREQVRVQILKDNENLAELWKNHYAMETLETPVQKVKNAVEQKEDVQKEDLQSKKEDSEKSKKRKVSKREKKVSEECEDEDILRLERSSESSDEY